MQAFEGAWEAACKVEGSTMVVPSGSVFLVKPVSFSGPNCEPNIVFQVKTFFFFFPFFSLIQDKHQFLF